MNKFPKFTAIVFSLFSCVAISAESKNLDFGSYIGKMFPDGSGSIAERFNPNKTIGCKSFFCEHKRKNTDSLTTFEDTWSFQVKNDEMTDAQKITAQRYYYKLSQDFGEMRMKANIYLWLDLSDGSGELLCVAGHNFPGKKAMIRIDNNKAIETNKSGCLIISNAIDAQLRLGNKITIRGYHWPYQGAETAEIDLGGYTKVSDFLRGMRKG